MKCGSLCHVPTYPVHTILTSGIGRCGFLRGTRIFIVLLILLSVFVIFLSREPEEEHVVVIVEEDKAVMKIPVEEYMVGAMAAVIDPEYEIECQKALAVLIRGNLEGNRQDNEMEVVMNEPYYDFAARRQLYGEDQKEYEEKFAEAIEATAGLIAVSGNHILEGNYHSVSAGMTRAAADSDSVACNKSMEAEDFFYQKDLNKENVGTIGEIRRDSAGYVEEILVDGKVVSGEYFREKMGLPSANFEVEEGEDSYLIVTRGKGHGLGMDIYYANELAKQGFNYNQILDYFFKDFILKKIIV